MTGTAFSRDAAYSVFESLRPGSDQSLDRAAFATYSLDLVAVAALILSLGRAGEQELEAGPLAFIDALEAVAPRIDVVHQSDRLAPGARHFGVLHMLDRRFHAVRPPRGSSFHPKLALVRYTGPGKAVSWRLWLGSRNLTGGQDREAGLLLVGRVATRGGDRVPSVARMAADLLEPVGWVSALADELDGVRWRAPEGVRLRNVQWRRAGQARPFATHFRGATRSVAVSPFVDDRGLELLGGAGHLLLTTVEAASGLDASTGTELAVCRPPTYEIAMLVESPAAAPAVDDVSIPEIGGIHAKMLLRRGPAGDRLWIGSANLTRRGMDGHNAELLAELDVPRAAADALEAFAMDGDPFDAAEVTVHSETQARRAAERALDEALDHVTGAEFELRRDNCGLVVAVTTPLDDFLADHRLDAWLLTRPDAVARWEIGATSVLLVPGGVPIRLETVLVCFRAERLAGDCSPRVWAQAVTFPEHDADARDRAATAAYIGLAGAGAWLRAQLAGIAGVEGTTWTGAPRWQGSEFAGAIDGVPLAFEEVLAAWARNPDAFEERAAKLDGTLAALAAELASAPPEHRDEAAIARWGEVVDLWAAIRAATETTA